MGWDAQLVEWCVALGHLVVWVAIFNRMHATGFPRWAKKLGERLIYLALLLVGLFVWSSDLARYASITIDLTTLSSNHRISIGLGIAVPAWMIQPPVVTWVAAYRILCLVSLTAVSIRWILWRFTLRTPPQFILGPAIRHRLLSDDPRATLERLAPVMAHGAASSTARTTASNQEATEPHDPLSAGQIPTWCGDPLTRILARFPGNQILDLEVNAKTLVLPQLPRVFDGMTIAHVSDFHLTGRMTQRFYQSVMQLVSSLDCDVVVLSGDIIDKAHCLDWLEPIFSQTHAREAKLFVLGNHDKRIADELDIRRRMTSAGWQDVAGKWWLQEIGGERLAWSGNELPWYYGARDLPARARQADEARVLIAHSPDQIDFAVQRDFDLVLAGHTHGGQIRPPIIGPIISPSHYGPKYASGEFRVANTWMHVSRGIAGTHVVRLNCVPEITRLVLRRQH